VELQVTADVAKTVGDFLTLQHRLEEPGGGFASAANYLRGREARRFASRGDGSWPPLAKSTVRRKGNARMLYLTGALERSLTTSESGNVERISGQTMTFGTSLFYGRFVAKKRPLFNTTPADRREVSTRRWCPSPWWKTRRYTSCAAGCPHISARSSV
jgi:hypothetical protein